MMIMSIKKTLVAVKYLDKKYICMKQLLPRAFCCLRYFHRITNARYRRYIIQIKGESIISSTYPSTAIEKITNEETCKNI